MAQIEFTTKIYDETGLISTETKMIEEPLTIEQRITLKEEQLLSMYEELERLKALKN
jgi:hypothetical protein